MTRTSLLTMHMGTPRSHISSGLMGLLRRNRALPYLRRKSPTLHLGDSDSFSRQSVWDMRWKQCHWKRLLRDLQFFAVNIIPPIRHSHIHSSIANAIVGTNSTIDGVLRHKAKKNNYPGIVQHSRNSRSYWARNSTDTFTEMSAKSYPKSHSPGI